MRAVKLAEVAAQAEKLRLQALAQRQVRGLYGPVAAVFAVGALALGHLVAFLAIVPSLGSLWTSLVLLAFDLLVAVVLGAVAALSKPGEIEAEAQRLKEIALRQMRQDLTVAALVPALRLFVGTRRAREGALIVGLALRLLRRRPA
jgi:hypothetical protein